MEKEKRGTSATRAKRKYNKANYELLQLWLPKGCKDKYKEVAAVLGISVTEFIRKTIEEKIERESLPESKLDAKE